MYAAFYELYTSPGFFIRQSDISIRRVKQLPTTVGGLFSSVLFIFLLAALDTRPNSVIRMRYALIGPLEKMY